MSLLFLDTETTGLDPRVHVPWEVAIVEPDGTERVWFWRPADHDMAGADPAALDVGRFRERAPLIHDAATEIRAAADIAELVEGNIIVGSKPSFDVGMLEAWFDLHGLEWTAHHRPVCVATMAYGWLLADTRYRDLEGDHEAMALPWSSDRLSAACGVEPPTGDERHTALGDARWVARWYRALAGEVARG